MSQHVPRLKTEEIDSLENDEDIVRQDPHPFIAHAIAYAIQQSLEPSEAEIHAVAQTIHNAYSRVPWLLLSFLQKKIAVDAARSAINTSRSLR